MSFLLGGPLLPLCLPLLEIWLKEAEATEESVWTELHRQKMRTEVAREVMHREVLSIGDRSMPPAWPLLFTEELVEQGVVRHGLSPLTVAERAWIDTSDEGLDIEEALQRINQEIVQWRKLIWLLQRPGRRGRLEWNRQRAHPPWLHARARWCSS